jgi:membrane-associated phospholipid phosphatase
MELDRRLESGTGSFPPGQAATAATVAIMLVLLMGPRSVRSSYLLLVAALYACVMASSRIYLRVQWLTDVVEGLALGGAIALTVVLIVRVWATRSRRHLRIGAERTGGPDVTEWRQ